jgi:hypothetical protein
VKARVLLLSSRRSSTLSDPSDSVVGIGQEAFDARFAEQLLALREMGSSAGVVGSTFVHADLGVAFDCPAGWTLRDQKDVQEGIEARLISRDNELVNKVMRELSAKYMPLAVLAAPTLDDPIAHLGPHEITPLITLMHEHTMESDEAPTFDLLEYVNSNLFYQRVFLQDFRHLQRPERTTLSESDAVLSLATYTALMEGAVEDIPFRERSYHFTRDRDVYTIRMGDYPDRDARLAFDFSDVVSSICLR